MTVRKDSKRVQVDIPSDWVPEVEDVQDSEFRQSQHSAILMLLREALDARNVRKQRRGK